MSGSMQGQIDALNARVTKLEGAAAESPNGATISQAGQALVIKGVTWLLIASVATGLVLRRDGAAWPSSNVVLGLRHDDLFYQRNSFGSWYQHDAAGASKQVAGDPRLPPPIVVAPPGVPAPAAAVGYTTRTLGPAVTLGQVWHRSSDASTAKQLPDGSVWMAGPWTYNDQVNTLGTLAVGGGAYIEADFKWDGAYTGNGGWPSFWANSIEGRSVAFPNSRGVEPDFCEFWGGSNWGGALHDWYGGAGAKVTQGLAINMPAGQSGNARHKYGALWVPATATTKGRMEFYFDRVLQPAMTIVWTKYNPADQPPYVKGTTAGANIDVQHLTLILGTGASNPMTVYGVEVWQKSGAGNLPPS